VGGSLSPGRLGAMCKGWWDVVGWGPPAGGAAGHGGKTYGSSVSRCRPHQCSRHTPLCRHQAKQSAPKNGRAKPTEGITGVNAPGGRPPNASLTFTLIEKQDNVNLLWRQNLLFLRHLRIRGQRLPTGKTRHCQAEASVKPQAPRPIQKQYRKALIWALPFLGADCFAQGRHNGVCLLH
jgi:hypothetical protein